MRLAVEQQNEKVEKATRDVEEIVQEMKEGESRAINEMREIREEVNNVREMLPKVTYLPNEAFDPPNTAGAQMMEKNKESQQQTLAELQQELKSMKALLLSRGPSSPSGFSIPIVPSKPAIPAWQLAASTPSPSTPSIPPQPQQSAPIAPSPTSTNKGKGVEIPTDGPTTPGP